MRWGILQHYKDPMLGNHLRVAAAGAYQTRNAKVQSDGSRHEQYDEVTQDLSAFCLNSWVQVRLPPHEKIAGCWLAAGFSGTRNWSNGMEIDSWQLHMERDEGGGRKGKGVRGALISEFAMPV